MTAATTELAAVFDALCAIFEPYRTAFKVTSRKGFFSLDDHSIRGWSIGFGAVVAKRGKVSFYLNGAEHVPGVFDAAPTALLARRTKAKFFNFVAVDAEAIAALRKIVKRTFAGWDAAAITRDK